MATDDELRPLEQDLANRKYRDRGPKKIGDAVNRLFARRGYARILQDDQWTETWQRAAGSRLAKHSRPGNLRKGVLEIVVRNSAALQELAFQKRSVLKKLKTEHHEIKDLRFRIGEID